jgi:hypothetical protein
VPYLNAIKGVALDNQYNEVIIVTLPISQFFSTLIKERVTSNHLHSTLTAAPTFSTPTKNPSESAYTFHSHFFLIFSDRHNYRRTQTKRSPTPPNCS